MTSIDPQVWRYLSRMHQLAIELSTGMRHSRGPLLRSMYLEGLIDTDLRGTAANKRMVLQAMVDQYGELVPGWEPSPSIKRALNEEDA